MSKPLSSVHSAFQVSFNGATTAVPPTSTINRSRALHMQKRLRYVGPHVAPGGRWLNASFLQLGGPTDLTPGRFRKNQPFRLRCYCPAMLKVPESLKTPVDVQVPNRCVIEEIALRNLQRSGYLVRESTIDRGEEGERELRRNLNSPLMLIWVRGTMHHLGAVDARDQIATPKIGSLGGDLGEWLIGLAAYEAIKNEAASEEAASRPRRYLRWWEVEWWLFVHLFLLRLWHPERKLSFSFVTDETRLARAVANANTWYWAKGSEETDATQRPRTWGRWWGLQYYLMWHWNQGSEFWKMVTDWNSDANSGGADTEGLGVRRHLAMFCVRAFYRIMWWWNIYRWWWVVPPRLITLQGTTRYLDGVGTDGGEVAWLNIKTATACNDDLSVPLVSGSGRQGKRYYVYHEQWVQRQRLTIGKTLALLDRTVDAEALRDKMNEIGGGLKQMLVDTAVRPSWDRGREVPEWDVTYQPHERGEPEVRQSQMEGVGVVSL